MAPSLGVREDNHCHSPTPYTSADVSAHRRKGYGCERPWTDSPMLGCRIHLNHVATPCVAHHTEPLAPGAFWRKRPTGGGSTQPHPRGLGRPEDHPDAPCFFNIVHHDRCVWTRAEPPRPAIPDTSLCARREARSDPPAAALPLLCHPSPAPRGCLFRGTPRVGDEQERYRSRLIVAVPEAPLPLYLDSPFVQVYSTIYGIHPTEENGSCDSYHGRHSSSGAVTTIGM